MSRSNRRHQRRDAVNFPSIKRTCGLNFARLRIWRPTRRAAPRQRALISLRNEVVPALFWGKAGWRFSASWEIILISQGVKRKRSQPATTSSRCREVHIFLRRGDEGSARPFQHARTLHDVAIVPLAMASARWASPTPDNSLSRRPLGCHSRRKTLMHGGECADGLPLQAFDWSSAQTTLQKRKQ
jgi:hypothetical protein